MIPRAIAKKITLKTVKIKKKLKWHTRKDPLNGKAGSKGGMEEQKGCVTHRKQIAKCRHKL